MSNDNDYKNVSAWFIGPKGENGDLFKELAVHTIDEHIQYRKEHYKKDDPAYITPEMKHSAEYQEQTDNIRRVQAELLERLHGSVPFYTPRYQAHMLWDTVIPGTIGYLSAMLYNQNNVATEASPATSQMELEAGQQLCSLLGYEAQTSWGHITADGSIANLEAMWAARNLKYYPLAVKEALQNAPELKNAAGRLYVTLPDQKTKKLLADCCAWELLNLDEDTILDLPAVLMNLSGLTSDLLNECLSPYTLQNKGLAYYARKYPDIKEPKIFVPATNHYSWPKAATILRLGKDCVEGIPVTEYCTINMEILDSRLKECQQQQIPVIMLVNVIGSTEEGAVDNLFSTLASRKCLCKTNFYFHIHCDAAWGGYLRTMFVEPQKQKTSLQSSAYVPVLPVSMFCGLQYENLWQADSITIDPHKAGFIPYPAGSLCYRNEKMRSLVTFDAAYIYSDPGLNMGIYGVEGSKPGAAAAAVWTAHRAISLDKAGYGRILGECAFSAKRYYCQWLTLADASDDFEIRMLVKLPDRILDEKTRLIVQGTQAIKDFIKERIIGKSNEEISLDKDAMQVMREVGTDVLINSFVVNYKDNNGNWNHDPEKLNQLNHEIFMKFSISDPATAQKDNVDYIIMMTSLDTNTYAAPLKDMMTAWGISLDGVSSINCLVNTVMNPWTTANGFIEKISAIFKKGIEECVNKIKGEN